MRPGRFARIIALQLLSGYLLIGGLYQCAPVKKFQPYPRWQNDSCHVHRSAGSVLRLDEEPVCTILPDVYSAPVRYHAPIRRRDRQYYLPEEGYGKIDLIFSTSAPNTVGTTQMNNGIVLLTFGEKAILAKKIISNLKPYRKQHIYNLEISRGDSYPVGFKSMLFIHEGIVMFDPLRPSLKKISCGNYVRWADRKGEKLFSVVPDFEMKTSEGSAPYKVERRNFNRIEVINTMLNEVERFCVVPESRAFDAIDEKFFYMKGNWMVCYDTELKSIHHPLLDAIRKIPRVPDDEISQLFVSRKHSIAIARHDSPLSDVPSVYLLCWQNPELPWAVEIIRDNVALMGFSPDYRWFHFERWTNENRYMVFGIEEDGLVQPGFPDNPIGGVISKPICLDLPVNMEYGVNYIPPFTWVTEPTGLATCVGDSIYRWTLPK